MAEIAGQIGSCVRDLDQDLLLTGALLHDIGKAQEYSYVGKIDYTNDGRLLGHIVMGYQMLDEQMSQIVGFPAELRLRLLHIILSHHGQYEFQSPKRPKFAEALIIHHADMLEADLWKFKDAKEKFPGQDWSPFLPSLERYLYLKDKEGL
ncbi:MAG: HD domain-containing protein [Peptococcaceae bacterium]|nr:HD domain-containing protein [Peptococcaceae bacterium]